MAYSNWSVVFGEQPSAAKWNILGTNDAHFYSFLGDNLAWQSWTPTWTNFTVGSATVTGRYTSIGKLVALTLNVILSGSTMGTGPTFSLPVTAQASTAFIIGHTRYLDTGTANFSGFAALASTTTAILVAIGTGGATASDASVTSTVPHTWANTDVIRVTGIYEAA